MSITDIAEKRLLSVNTIETHLAFYISSGKLDINNFVPPDKQELIRTALTKYGKSSLRILKENLPEEIGYGDIKFTIAATEINS
jgi:ATP-dependent DNA helicase RecQ